MDPEVTVQVDTTPAESATEQMIHAETLGVTLGEVKALIQELSQRISTMEQKLELESLKQLIIEASSNQTTVEQLTLIQNQLTALSEQISRFEEEAIEEESEHSLEEEIETLPQPEPTIQETPRKKNGIGKRIFLGE